MSEVLSVPPQPPRSPRPRAATRQLWLDRLTRFADSGLTPAQFCAIEAVSLPSFYSWKRRLADQLSPTTSHDHAPQPTPRLLPVRLQPLNPTVELVLPTGAVLRLPPGCDLAWVRSLVATLGGASC